MATGGHLHSFKNLLILFRVSPAFIGLNGFFPVHLGAAGFCFHHMDYSSLSDSLLPRLKYKMFYIMTVIRVGPMGIYGLYRELSQR